MQVTGVLPIGNVESDAGVHVTGSVPSTMSVAEALKVTFAPAVPVAADRDRAARYGHDGRGGVDDRPP